MELDGIRVGSKEVQLNGIRAGCSEMEKRADGADASVLFFLLGCANSLAVYAKIR